MSIKNLVSGYHYTTREVIRWGNRTELEKIARSENRKFRKQRRIDRCVVYPIAGPIGDIGQLVILR